MKKTYGGFLGAKMAFVKKVKRIQFAAFAVVALLMIGTIMSADVSIGGKIFAGSTVLTLAMAAPAAIDPTKVKSAEEIVVEKLGETVKSIVDEKLGATKGEITTINNALKALEGVPQLSQELKAELIRIAAELKAVKEIPAPGKEKGYSTIKEALYAAFAEKKSAIDELVKNPTGQKEGLVVEVKAVVDMSDVNEIGSGSTQVTLTDVTGKIIPIRKRTEVYMAQVSVGSMIGNRALWIEETAVDGTPIMLAEGAGKTQLSSIWNEKTSGVKKIAVFGKVTTELMADLPQLVSYISASMLKRMEVKLEDQLFNGNGAGDNLQGSIGLATAFSAGGLANTIDNANEYDVCDAVATQCILAFGMPNAMFIHPETLTKMRTLKAAGSGEYLLPLFATVAGLEISGMKIIATPAMTVDTFLGGDLSVINVLNRSILSLQIGLDGNDFTQNKKTILAERRICQFVAANDQQVLITGTFTVAKALLQK